MPSVICDLDVNYYLDAGDGMHCIGFSFSRDYSMTLVHHWFSASFVRSSVSAQITFK